MDNNPTTQTMTAVPEAPKQNSLYTVFKYVAVGTGILGIGFLIALGGFLLAQNNQKTKTQGTTVQTQITAPASKAPAITTAPKDLTSTIKDNGVSNQKVYTNPKFGIEFIFSDKFAGEKMDVKEAGNKIYVFDTKYPYTQGQYIEVFDKDVSDNLDQAMQKQFLTNISSKDCFVKISKPDSAAKFPVNFEVRTLGYPVDLSSDLPSFAQSNKCPAPYAESNGLSYFLGDINHPKLYLFFSIGQQEFPISEDSNIPWQDTIKFLD